MIERPALETARKLSIELTLCPVVGAHGAIESVEFFWECNGKVPKQRGSAYSMLCTGDGVLTFNDFSRDSVHQRTLDETKPDKPKTEDEK